jgi:hypothetical protein
VAVILGTGSRTDEVNAFFSMYLSLSAVLGSGVHSASNRNEYQKQENHVSGGRARPVRKAD